MKSPIKIILIVIAVLQLIAILYIVLPSIQKNLRGISSGNTYKLDTISLAFDLTNNNYEAASPRENIESGRELTALKDPNSEKEVYVMRITDTKYIEIFNEKLRTLRNPFKARFAINRISKDVAKRLEKGSIQGQDFKKMKMETYKGQNREFIFTTIIFTDGHTDYTVEGQIEGAYYSIDLINETGPEDVFKFMKTATIIRN
jgi:hypothetical protein